MAHTRLDPGVARKRALAAGFEPLEPYVNSRTPWRCRCQVCGKTVAIRLGSLRGCKWCARLAVDPDDASATMREAGLAPKAPYPGCQKPWLCVCLECGAEVTPQYANVRIGQRGCAPCSRVSRASSGFDTAAPAVVYVVTHDKLGAAKVGIGGADLGRLYKHTRHGWKSIAVIRAPGTVAVVTERAVLRWWREELCLPVYLGPAEMPQGGWTETAELDEVDIAETVRRVKSLVSRNDGAIAA